VEGSTHWKSHSLTLRLSLSVTVSLDGKVARLESLDPNVKVEASTASATANGATAVTSDTTAAQPESSNAPVKEQAPVPVVVAAADLATSATEIAAIEEEPSSRKRKEPPATENDNDAENPDGVKVDWLVIQTELEELVGLPAAKEVVELLDPQQSSGEKKFVRLPHQADKNTRRRLHQWIRDRIAFCAEADTEEGAVRIWDKKFEREMPGFGKFDRSDRRNRNQNQNQNGGEGHYGPGGGAAGSQSDRGGDRPGRAPPGMRYLQFVLYKENMDTGGAVNQIQKRSSNHNKKLRIGYAGMKDKRGITSQFITVPASTPIRSLCSWNEPGRGGGHTTKAGVSVVRVGNFEYTDTEMRLGRLRGNRFDVALRNVRYPGHDKASTQASLEKAALALRRAGFINYFGTQRFGKYHDTHLTGVAVLKGDYEKAVEIIMEPKPDEREWGASARKAWAERFQAGGDRAAAEKACAGKVVRELGRFMASEVAIVQSLLRQPLDYKRAFSCISKTMRMMFIHALQSYLWNHVASFRIEKLGNQVIFGDLVLVDEKNNDSTDNGTNGDTSGIPAVKVVTAEDVAAGSFTIEDIVLPLIGAGTRDPENECSKVYDEYLEKHGLTRKMLDQLKDRDFNCAGDYRKVLCRPSDVDFEILEYKDSLTPLMQTDLMKINGIDLDLGKGKGKEGDPDEPLLAMVVGFTLPSSSYATIALRELMKRPTSSEYQRELKLDGDKTEKVDATDKA
jgi:tRNA pseudouridine13 synthase